MVSSATLLSLKKTLLSCEYLLSFSGVESMQVDEFISESIPEPGVASLGSSLLSSSFNLVGSSELATLLLVSSTFLSTILFLVSIVSWFSPSGV
uniref:Uncharacterized protein n=1 Tax=Arundo donax TaxID=35708 RepID=A0A0A9CYJ4_ARUDO